MNIKQIKERYTCLDYLGEPLKKTRNAYIYRAPWREDKHPSLNVTPSGRGWHDLATGEHGDLIHLVMRCLGTTEERLAIAELSKNTFSFSKANKKLTKEKEERVASFAFFGVVPLQERALFAYLHQRGVNIDIAKKFLQEAHYSFQERDDDSYLYALAYPNDKGGYELRSSKYQGGNSPKGITTHLFIDGAPIIVFEGFFDMLSFATLSGGIKHNFLVLNSTVNVAAALEKLKNFRGKIYLSLDNDPGGRTATKKLLDALPTAVDISSRFAPFKDVNDYLKNLKAKPKC